MIEILGYAVICLILIHTNLFTLSDACDDLYYERKMKITILYVLFPFYYFRHLIEYLSKRKIIKKFFELLNKDWARKV